MFPNNVGGVAQLLIKPGAVKMEVPRDHSDGLLKEQSFGPEVLIGKREPVRNPSQARSGVGWDKHRRKRSGATPRLSPARMLKATEDPRADLPPCQVREYCRKKSIKKGPGERPVEKKGKRADHYFQGFFFLLLIHVPTFE